MGTVIDFAQHDHIDRHQLWDRFERADLFEQYLDLQTQGVSQRQAAKELQVPRTTLQAWQSWHETLNPLQVLGRTKPPQIDERVGHQFHGVVPTLQVLESQQQPLKFVFPGKSPLYPVS